MKNYLNILTLFVLHFFLYSCEKTVDIGKEPEGTITFKDNLILYKGEIFTGKLIKTDYKGNTLVKSEYKDGKLNGVFESYGENGKLTEKYTAINGIPNGINETFFYPSGNIKKRENFKNGVKDGLSETFYEPGLQGYTPGKDKKTSATYKDGVEITYAEYRSNGNPYLKRNTTLQNGIKKLYFERYRENGVLETSGIVINDTSDVLERKFYDENGKLKD